MSRDRATRNKTLERSQAPLVLPPSSHDSVAFRDELPFKIFDEVSRMAHEVAPGTLGLLDFGDRDKERPDTAFGVRLAVVVNISLRNHEAILYPVLDSPLKSPGEVPVIEEKSSTEYYAQTGVRYTCFPEYLRHYLIPVDSCITSSSLRMLRDVLRSHPELENGIAIDFYNNTAAKGFDANREDPYDEVIRRKGWQLICKQSERTPPNPYSPPTYGRDDFFRLLAAKAQKKEAYDQNSIKLGDLVLFDLRDLLCRGYIPGSLHGVRLGLVMSILGTKSFDDRYVELLPVTRDKSGLKDEVPIKLQNGDEYYVEGNLAARWKLKNLSMLSIFRGHATQESFAELMQKRPFWECTKRRLNTYDLLRLESYTNARTFESRPAIPSLKPKDLESLDIKDFDKLPDKPKFGFNHVADVEVGDLILVDAGPKEDFIPGCVYGKTLVIVAKINVAKTYANIYKYPVTISSIGDPDEFEISLGDGRIFYVQSRQVMRLNYPSAQLKIDYVGRAKNEHLKELIDEARLERSYLTPLWTPNNNDCDNRIDWLKQEADKQKAASRC